MSVTDLFMRGKLNTRIYTSVYLYCCCYWRSVSHRDGQELASDTVYLRIVYWSARSLTVIVASSNICLVKCTIISLLQSVYGEQNWTVIVGKQINLIEKRWQRGFIVGLVSWGFQDKKQTTVSAPSLHLAQISRMMLQYQPRLEAVLNDSDPFQKFISMLSQAGGAVSWGFNVISRVTWPS